MKKINLIFAGLMALVMTSLTSCLGNSDDADKGSTYYIDDFMNLTEKGKILTTDDNQTFTMENFAAFAQEFKDPPTRMFIRMSMYVDAGKTLEDAYKTPLYPVTVIGACPAGVYQVVTEKPEDISDRYNFSSFTASASKVFLNCFVYTTVAKNPQRGDFKAYVSGVSDEDVIYVKVNNCTPQANDNLSGSYGLSFPLNELLAGQKLVLDKDGCVTLNVNGQEVKVLMK